MDNIKNNKEEVPIQFYTERFAKLDPEQRAKELLTDYTDGKFSVTMYGTDYKISWPGGNISCADPDAIALRMGSAQILLLRYLISGKPLPFAGKYMTFRELPWGETYIKPFTGRCLTRMAWKYNGSPDAFCKAAEALGGRPLDHGDAGFRFDFIGDYHLLFYLWAGDDEFPPNAQIEFSDNFAAGFTAEDSVVIAELMISAISQKMKAL